MPRSVTHDHQRLYINIDHIATVRQARRGDSPDPVEGAVGLRSAPAPTASPPTCARIAATFRTTTSTRLATTVTTVLNLEMACTDEMLAIAERLRPHQVTLVPERREEITTEGGLDVSQRSRADRATGSPGSTPRAFVPVCSSRPISTRSTGRASSAPTAIELHTGPYAHHADRSGHAARACVTRRARGASLGLAVHAGHGLTVGRTSDPSRRFRRSKSSTSATRS